LVALTETEHQLFESPCNLLALRDRFLKEILVELAHKAEAGAFVKEIKLWFCKFGVVGAV